MHLSARRNCRRQRRRERLIDRGLDVHGTPRRHLPVEVKRGELLTANDERFEQVADPRRYPSADLLLDSRRGGAETDGAAGFSAPSVVAASPAKNAPSARRSATCAAARTASLVFPVPPGPVSVTSR